MSLFTSDADADEDADDDDEAAELEGVSSACMRLSLSRMEFCGDEAPGAYMRLICLLFG